VAQVQCVGPVEEKAHCPKVFVFVKGLRKVFVSEMRNEVKMSGWIVDS